MKNKFKSVWSFATAKLQAKRRSLLAIIALLAVIGFMILPLTGCEEPKPFITAYILQPPLKSAYTVGAQSLDLTGMSVTANYSDKTSKDVTNECTTEGFVTTEVADKITITVKYKGEVAGTFDISVNDKQTVATPTAEASLAGGNLIVTLSTTTEGAAIYYTVDGTTTPTDSSTLYNDPISISAATTIKAIAVKVDWNDSTILTAAFAPPIDMPTADKWYDGSLTLSAREQWFKFTSTATTQYIHFQAGTMSSVNMQIYAADGITTVGNTTTFGSSTVNTSRTLTNNTPYLIKITSVANGTYKIAFNTTSSSPTIVTLPTTGITELTSDKWADSSIAEAGGEQWFKLTTAASGTSIYIHFMPGTLSGAYVQMYTSEGRVQGERASFTTNSSTLYAYRTGLTASTVYYIRVTPSSSTYTGTFRVGFNTTTTTPSITIPATGVTTLTNAETWYDGTLTAGGEQWFKFTATVTGTQYIHFQPGTLTRADVQLYDNSGAPVSTRTSLGGSNVSITRSTSVSGVYYILILPYSSTINAGTYKIAFGTTTTQPAITVPSGTIPELTADTWTDGNITTAGGEQWFKFTATATNQYIHFLPGALNDVYVRLFIQAGTNVGNPINLDSSTISTTITLNVNTVYFIKVTPFSTSGSGAYKIGFNTTAETPPVTPSPVPTTGFTVLTTVDQFYDGNITTAGGEQWFKFTSTVAGYQYIHFDNTGTLTDVYAQLYTSDGRLLGGRTNFWSSTTYTSRTVSNGNEYYIKVTPGLSTGKGTYKIGFNTSSTVKPKITLPTTGVTTLTVGTWGSGNIAAANGEQWFTFTATATSHYIFLQNSGTLNDIYVQLYDAEGRATGSKSELYSYSTNGTSSVNRTGLTANAVYYIKVIPYSSTGSGTFKLGISTSTTAPTN